MRELDGKGKEILRSITMGQVSLLLRFRNAYKNFNYFDVTLGCWKELLDSSTGLRLDHMDPGFKRIVDVTVEEVHTNSR